MGTLLLIQSTAEKEVKPNIIEFSIDITEKGQEAEEVIKSINSKREFVKYYIMDRSSYKKDSYKQTNINFKKIVDKQIYYTNGTQIVSQQEYSIMTGQIQQTFTKKIKEQFLYYEASLNISATLEYGETIVNDTVNIYNMAIEHDFRCRYNHYISNDIFETINNDLYIDCINKGMEQVKYIVNGVDKVKKESIKLLQISDPELTKSYSNMEYAKRASASQYDSYTPEPIMMPEIIADVFNNTITLDKTLDLKFEI